MSLRVEGFEGDRELARVDHGLPEASSTPSWTLVAWEDGDEVARCTAFVDSRQRWRGERVGAVGFFESRYSAASLAVLAGAEDWLRSQGLGRFHGPIQGSVWGGYRWMTEGFALPSFPGEPRNPPSYEPHFREAGLEPSAWWLSWDLDCRQIDRAWSRLADPVAQASRWRSRGLRPAGEEGEEDLETLHRLVLETFRDNPAFVPAPYEVFARRFRPLVSTPGLVRLIEGPKGQPGGFSAAFLDPGEPERAILFAFGLRDEVRGKGLFPALVLRPSLEAILDAGCRELVAALHQRRDGFWGSLAPPSRLYALYGKVISRG